MMRTSHTCRSRSPVTHPKTPVDSTPRPITAAAPRKRATTHHYKSHPSYNSHHWLLPTKPPLSRFLHCLGFNPAYPMLVGNAAEQGGCPRSCGRPLCSSTSPPSPRDGLPLLLNCPGQESQRSLASSIFLLAIAPLRHMPGAATWYLESLYF